VLRVSVDLVFCNLTVRFIDAYSNGTGEIQTSHWANDGNRDGLFGMLIKNRIRQALCFASKDQDVAVGVLSRRVLPLCFLRKEPKRTSRQSFPEIRPGIDRLPIEVFPIVQSRAAKIGLGELKTERSNEPKFRLQGNARAANIARILRYLGLVQDDMQGGFCAHGTSDDTRCTCRDKMVPAELRDTSAESVSARQNESATGSGFISTAAKTD
jgi:hypothetical protein